MRKPGFSLLELVIVLALMALVFVIAVPNFRGKKEKHEIATFVERLNSLMQVSWRNALLNHTVQRVTFDFIENRITLTQLTKPGPEQKDDPGVAIKGAVGPTELAIPSLFSFVNFYIDGRDEMVYGKRHTAWFFMLPDGTVQAVIANVSVQTEEANVRPRSVGLVLNPFSAQFELHDGYQRP